MQLHPAQNKIASDVHRFRVVCSGRRFGKTSLSAEEIKGKAISREARIAYISPTYQQSRDIMWETLKKELEPIILNINESRLELKVRNIKNTESIIVLRGWEAVDTLRGQYFDFIVIDEVASMRNFWIGWEEVIRPTLTDKRGEVLFIGTPQGFNHFYDLYNMENDPIKGISYKSFHFTSFDNPFISPDELNDAKKDMTEDRFAQEYLADFRKQEGLVYKEFSRAKHLFDDEDTPKKTIDRFSGVDFGYTNPAAIITIIQDYDNRYWITDEYYRTGKTDAEIAEIVANEHYNKVYPDPENAAAAKELSTRGVNIKIVNKGPDSIINGIQKVRNLFKEGRLRIHKRCTNLIYEMETYAYDEKKDKHNPKEVPIDENNHALDAMRYALMSHVVSSGRKATVFYPKHLKR